VDIQRIVTTNGDKMRQNEKEISDAIETEHLGSKKIFILAEQQIKQQHSHKDGTPVMLHELSPANVALRSELEGKLEFQDNKVKSLGGNPKYDKPSFESSDFSGVDKRAEVVMMGCNCGAEWTITGKKDIAASFGIKINQYIKVEGGQKSGYGSGLTDQNVKYSG
jgi:hypothetical protein